MKNYFTETFMKALKIIGIVLLALIGVVIILGIVAPKSYHVDRSITIEAPKHLVFNYVKYWRNWKAWSPWAEMDSTMQVTIAGKNGSDGSMYQWQGNKVGSGTMTTMGIKENEEIAYHLKFLKPWESESDGYLKLVAVDEKTQATWGFYGKNPFPWNVFSLFMSMDKMVGKDFERGLELLKDICEKEAVMVGKYTVAEVEFPVKIYAVIRQEVTFDQLQNFFAESYAKIMKEITKKGVKMEGAPAALYFHWDEQNNMTNVAAAIPIKNFAKLEGIETIPLPAMTAFWVDYYGLYRDSGPAHRACDLYLSQKGLKQKSPVIEEYVTDPSKELDSSKWLTRIYYFGE
jgi:effector-binding domain-containing protein